MSNYATVQQVKDYKVRGVVALTAGLYTDPEIQTAIDLAESIIERITGDVFYELEETYLFDGSGEITLYFPPTAPYKLLEVTTAKELDSDQSTVLHTYTENLDFVRYAHFIQTVIAYPDDRPRRMFGRGGIWPEGQKNIEIDGTWGWETTPPEITEATILLVLERLIPGSTRMNRKDAQTLQWDDFRITFRGSGLDTRLTGFTEVDRLLENYINYSGLFLGLK